MDMRAILSGAIALAAVASALVPASARRSLGAGAARAAAIKILLGDPYGKTPAQVQRTIMGQTLGRDDYCHKGKRVWKLHIVVAKSEATPDGIDGYLVLDAANGRMVCAGLPLLD